MLLLFALNVGNFRDRLLGRTGSSRIDSIAVLPFENVTKDSKTEYLSDGITESLINSLSQLPNLAVMSRNTVFRYKDQSMDPEKVGRDLGVRAILTGRLVQSGDDLMISVNLEDIRTSGRSGAPSTTASFPIWSPCRKRLQATSMVACAPRLSGEENRLLSKRPTEDAEAYQFYLQGLFYWNKWTEADFKKAADYFTQAVQKRSPLRPLLRRPRGHL